MSLLSPNFGIANVPYHPIGVHRKQPNYLEKPNVTQKTQIEVGFPSNSTYTEIPCYL